MTCRYCGEEARLEVMEIWDRDFTVDACCEGAYESWSWRKEDWTRDQWRAFFADAGFPCRGVPADLGRHLVVDWGLHLVAVTCAEAKAFVREHHRHNRPPVSWRWGHGIANGQELVGVAMVGRPVARAIDHQTAVEVNRLCVKEMDPPELKWNACSQLYGAAAREAKRRGFQKILTYTLETEAGTALRAVGWKPVAKTKGGSWNTPARPRATKAPTCRKVRWERELVA